MQIDIITIFPDMVKPLLNEGIIKQAIKKKLINIHIHNLRDWTTDKHHTTDDRPFGGGPGMIMKPEPLFKAVTDLKNKHTHIILLSPQGKTFTQQKAQQLTKNKHLILICGRYEGVDQRVHDYLINEKISIGQYTLTGGELPAMIVTDAVVRLLPGVLGNPESLVNETFSSSTDQSSIVKQDYPVYTQPRSFMYEKQELKVPDVLLSGNHQKIHQWRTKQTTDTN